MSIASCSVVVTTGISRPSGSRLRQLAIDSFAKLGTVDPGTVKCVEVVNDGPLMIDGEPVDLFHNELQLLRYEAEVTPHG